MDGDCQRELSIKDEDGLRLKWLLTDDRSIKFPLTISMGVSKKEL